MVGWLRLSSTPSPISRAPEEAQEGWREEDASPRAPPGFEVPFAFLDFDPVKEWLVDPEQLPLMLHPPPLKDGSSPSPGKLDAASPIDDKLHEVSLAGGGGGDVGLQTPDDIPLDSDAVGRIRGGVKSDGVGGLVDDSSKAVQSTEDGSRPQSSSESETEESASSTYDDSSSEEEPTSSSSEEEDGGGGGADKGRGRGMDEDVEAEEGEIKDSDWEKVAISSDDEEQEVVKGPIKSKHEIEVLPPVPQVRVSLEPHHQTSPVGFISSILGDRVIVEGSVKHNPLNEGSILWITESRSLLGLIDEIFGPVKNPYYVVRYNSCKEVPTEIREGTAISFVIEFANHILNEKDLYKKGYDASGENDEEVTDEVEFSDDEKEAEYRRSQRQTKRGTDDRRHRPRESAVDKRRFNFKGAGPQKGMQPPVPLVPKALDQPPPGASGSSQAAPVTSDFGQSGCSFSFGPGHASSIASPMVPAISQVMQACDGLINPSSQMPQHRADPGHPNVLPPQLQPNAVWPYGLPLQWQPSGVFRHGLPPQQLPNAVWAQGLPQQQQQQPNGVWSPAMPPQQQPSSVWTHELLLQQQQNVWIQGLPPQQQLMGIYGGNPSALQSHHLGGPASVHQLHNQVLNACSSGLTYQQQLKPNLGAPINVELPGGLLNNPSFGLMNTGPTGQGFFMQAFSGCSNMHEQGLSGSCSKQSYVQHPPATGQSGAHPCPQFNRGSSSGRGRKPHMKGGRHSAGRGDRARMG